MMSRVPVAAHLPPVAGMLLDGGNRVYLQEPATIAEAESGDLPEFDFDHLGSSRWIVADSSARVVSRFNLGNGRSLRAVRGDTLYVAERNGDDGVQSLVRFLVRLPRTAPR